MAEEISDIQLGRFRLKAQISNLETRKQQAVCVRNVHKRYGTKKNPINVLEDLSMTVPKGCIYGLLGASGCGKTTLINCIIGRKKVDSGEIWVLGGPPDTTGSGVPGPRIGYMPQEVALHGEFTIRETLKYFGWIAGLNTEKIEERLQFLVNLLNLPSPSQLVKNLSGGQQRRVSFAVALLHEPELLILDEPTVGLDSLLRETIWNFLLDLTRTKKTTVILTTHYIDETRQANFIGLLRGGYILDEESPESLLNRCATNTLEEAFLKLSVVQNLGRRRRSSIALEVASNVEILPGIVNQAAVLDDVNFPDSSDISGEFGDIVANRNIGRRVSIASIASPIPLPNKKSHSAKSLKYLVNFKSNRIKAILWKNNVWFIRNVPVLLSVFAVPILLVSLFCGCIGHEPMNLNVAVVNHETINAPCEKIVSCNSTQLSCIFLDYLGKRSLNLIHYDSEIEARESVLHGKTYASIVVRHNYTTALRNRFVFDDGPEEWDILESTVDVFRDVAIRDISFFMKLYLYEGLKYFLKDYLVACGVNPAVLSLPVKFNTPVLGLAEPRYSDFVTPGVILTTVFIMALGLTALSMLTERKEGILERSIVIGVNPLEILIAHIVCDSILVMVQIFLVFVFIFGIFHNVILGSYLALVVLTLLTGFCGMCLGFAVSSACDDERVAFQLLSGIFLPLFLLSGMIWPIEGMHYVLQYIAMLLPVTRPTESMRSILQRGWGFSEPVVYEGIISVSVWIIIFLVISIVCLKFRKGPLVRQIPYSNSKKTDMMLILGECREEAEWQNDEMRKDTQIDLFHHIMPLGA